MLSFAYKVVGEGKTHCYSLPNFKGYAADPTNDKALVEKLWEILNGADVLVAHNGDAFDIKKANARFIAHGLKPPKRTKTVDTLKVLKKYFKLDSNRLDSAAQHLGVGRKLPTGGFSLWNGCMTGEPKAWKLMEKYNKQDVDLLVKVFEKLRPWITNYQFNQNHTCPRCTVGHLQRRGLARDEIRFRYECMDCGRWSQK